MGGKSIQVDHEIQSSVIYPVLEVKINNNIVCIKRDLYNFNRSVEVFSCSFEDIKDNFPTRYAASLSLDSESLKSISEFIMGQLNFPKIKIKNSPSKDGSDVSRLSILDLFKFFYLDQDDVGSKNMLDIGKPIVETKNREVFKYIFNVLDTNITDLNEEISIKTKEKNDLESQFKIISRFLQDTEFEDINEISSALEGIEQDISFLKLKQNEINGRIIADSRFYNNLKDVLDTINLKILEQDTIKNKSLLNLERFGRLKNDYLNDIQKFKSAESANHLIGEEINIETICPICDSKMNISGTSMFFSITENKQIKNEISSLNKRVKELEQLIEINRSEVTNSSFLLKDLYLEKEKAMLIIDQELAKSVSPYLSERDAVIREITLLSEKKDKYRQTLKVRYKHIKISDEIGKLDADLIGLKDRLALLKEKAPSVGEIISELEGNLSDYLDKVHVNNKRDVSISERSFLPVINGVEYRNINSGGLRVIMSIGYMAVLLKSKMKNDINLPGFLMIDTVGKYLGKTKEKYQVETNYEDDVREGISDPDKYENIYKYLIKLAEDFENEGQSCQILLVDNDIPQNIADNYKGFIVAHFSSGGANGLPVGLIDDWDDINSKSEIL